MPEPTPVPDLQGPVPVAPGTYPFLAANFPGSPDAVDLEALGYVEEEFFMSGGADTWRYDSLGGVEIDKAGVPYTTRILVRRPADPRRASGVAHIDLFNPSQNHDIAPTWHEAYGHLTRNGDVYVGLTCKPVAVEALQKYYDPERYAPLEFPYNSQCWDIISQTAALLKAQHGTGSLAPIDVKRVYVSGWSQTGMYIRTFLNDGFHDRTRGADGAPLVDGYLIGVAPGMAYIPASFPDADLNDPAQLGEVMRIMTETVPAGDPRRVPIGQDVPVIDYMSEDEAVGSWFMRRADSDVAGDRYRLYQIPGRGHGGAAGYLSMLHGTKMLEGTDFPISIPAGFAAPPEGPFHIPSTPLSHSMFANLDAWVVANVPPPHADPIVLDPPVRSEQGTGSAVPRLDEHGHARGGIRTPQLDLPVARFSTAMPAGGVRSWVAEPFTAKEINATYGGEQRYRALYRDAVDAMVRRRWFLPVDAERLLEDAERTPLPFA